MPEKNTHNVISDIISECRKFAVNEIRENVLSNDLSPDINWVQRIWDKSRQMDLPSLPIPDTFLGGGCTALECAVVLNMLATECAGIASIYAHHFTACISLLQAPAEQQALLFNKICEKDTRFKIASVIFPPENDNTGLQWIEQNNNLIINGNSHITGNLSLSDGFILFLTKNDNPEDNVCVWIDRSVKGLDTDAPLQLPGLKANTFGKVKFNNVEIRSDQVLARKQMAKKMFHAAQSVFYGFIGAIAVGTAHQAFQKAIKYAKSRYQFGKNIIYHQEIQRMLGNMQIKLNAGTAVYQQIFEEKKWKLSFTTPDAPLAKAFCTDAALEIVMDAIQIHGGYGYMHEYGIEKMMRDIKVLQLIGGTNPYLKIKHIADRF